jgi:hypothetical protein
VFPILYHFPSLRIPFAPSPVYSFRYRRLLQRLTFSFGFVYLLGMHRNILRHISIPNLQTCDDIYEPRSPTECYPNFVYGAGLFGDNYV